MHTPSIDYNLSRLLLKRAELDPDNPAIVFEDSEWTYAQFTQRIRKLASALKAIGVNEGDRVGYVGVNHPTFVETLYASAMIGAIFVPLNFRLTGQELRYIINDAGLHTLVADNMLRPVIEPVRADLCCHQYLASEDAADGWQHVETIMNKAEPLAKHLPRTQHDTLVIMYTSGTTGKPKGAMLTHGNIVWNNLSAAFGLAASDDDISLVCAPLFHIGGLNVTLIDGLHNGGKIILHRGFDAAKTLVDLEKFHCTTMFGAPAMFLFMAQLPQFAGTDLSALRMLVVGAAPVPKSLLDIYGARNIQLNQGYGLTETSPFVSFLTSKYLLSKLGSAGKANMFGDVRISDAAGNSLPAGEVGEILYRGPNLMKGYWNRPEATAEAIDEKGWFHTGDAGFLDEDGFLFISDRVKDMVISGGENVYPAEVESVLFDHPAIAEVAVIGLPDKKWGEAVTAVAALNPGASLNLEELRDFATDQLARYKLPLILHIVDALPRNPAGKVLKFELREQFG